MLAESTLTRVAPVAGIAITHELMDGIELESNATADWRGTNESSHPLVIRHEVGDVSTRRMRRVLDVPPWCTFHVDERGEPSSRFHAVFGEVDRLMPFNSRVTTDTRFVPEARHSNGLIVTFVDGHSKRVNEKDVKMQAPPAALNSNVGTYFQVN